MMLLAIVAFGVIGCAVSWVVIAVVERFAQRLAHKQATQLHHTHSGFVPRVGGIGIAAAVVVGLILLFIITQLRSLPLDLYLIATGGALAAFAMGLWDDFRPLGAKPKLVIMILIASGVYALGLNIEKINIPLFGWVMDLPFASYLITVAWFVGMMNLINLIDGLDGLAGGIALMLMILLAYLNYTTSANLAPLFIVVIAGGIVGFLFHNFPPAKVYMGDSGAYMLGFLIAALALTSSEKGTIAAALVAPLLALALPIADVSFAIIRRGLSGLPLFRPDQHHIHHRLLRTGLSTKRTVLILYSVSLIALAFAFLNFAAQGRTAALGVGFLFVVILFVFRGQQLMVTTTSAVTELSEAVNNRRDTRNALYLKNWLVVEAERADSGQNLWQDFKFVLKKMGFCRASLTIGLETRTFYVPNTPHDKPDLLFSSVFTLDRNKPVHLALWGEEANFSERQFTLLADLAAESWQAAGQKWESVNGSVIDFHATAAESQTYRQQRNRALYRPTY